MTRWFAPAVAGIIALLGCAATAQTSVIVFRCEIKDDLDLGVDRITMTISLPRQSVTYEIANVKSSGIRKYIGKSVKITGDNVAWTGIEDRVDVLYKFNLSNQKGEFDSEAISGEIQNCIRH